MLEGDQLIEEPEGDDLREQLSRMAVPPRPPIGQVTARGRRLSRRRRGTAGAAGALGGALAIGLPLALSSAPIPHSLQSRGFELTSNENGTDTLTLSPAATFDSVALQQELSDHSIPAKVTVGSFCSSQPSPSGFDQAVSVSPAGPSTVIVGSGVVPTITINPAELPVGTELSFGIFQLSSGQRQMVAALIRQSSYSCSPTSPPPGEADFGVTLGPPG